MVKVKSIIHLKELVRNRTGDFRLFLNNEVFSRKYVRYAPEHGRFHIENCIDGSTQWLTEKQLKSGGYTLIGAGIEKGAFWFEEWI